MIAIQKLELVEAAVSLLYPPVCTICGKSIRGGEYLCERCEANAFRIHAPFCHKCSEPFDGSITSAFTCANCAHREIHFEAAVAAYRGRGVVRQIIHEFKYNRQIHLRHLVARWLGAALDDERLCGRRFDLIVPVPLHPARQRERGFNQAGLLAKLLARQSSIPVKPLLERIRYTNTQTALDRSERMENLHNAFRLRKNADVRGLRMLLVDDVLTTGATLNECARVLKRAGALSVHAATAARA
jgi:ComF family protein